jgi:hypothetical protein
MERMHEGDDATPCEGCMSGGSWLCKSSSEMALKAEKHDKTQRTQQLALPSQALESHALGPATFREGGMIRSRVLRDPSCFFINWPKRQRVLSSFARLTGLIRPGDQ